MWKLGLLLLAIGSGGGCVQVMPGKSLLPTGHTLVREQLVFHSRFPLATHHRLLEDLTARRQDVSQRLDLPVSDEPIHVYLFDDAEPFDAFVQSNHPDFPDRRAYFLETDTRLLVYARWGDRVAEDLRHEVVHGYLHSVVPNLPIWLDEGLAEYFEVPRGYRGRNATHLDQLAEQIRQNRWSPNLERLESLDPRVDMSYEDYAESWAWVHLLLESPLAEQAILPTYLASLRREGTAEPVSMRIARVVPNPESLFLGHLTQAWER